MKIKNSKNLAAQLKSKATAMFGTKQLLITITHDEWFMCNTEVMKNDYKHRRFIK